LTIRPKPFAVARAFLGAFALALAMAAAAAPARDAASSGGAQLRERFASMRDQIRHNGFGEPLRLLSHETDHAIEGEVYALVDHPFGQVREALHEPGQWCDVLVLPFNVKGCEARPGEDARLALLIGRHKDSTPDDVYRLDFRFREEARDDDFLRIALRAPSGPLGTHDYRIVLEATPAADPERTIVHLRYAYGYGWVSQLAMKAYLSTVGADNVGFTVQGRDGDGRPVYVRGMRGVMERNTMRYFLAIEAYLASLSAPPARRDDARLEAWFRAVERYPRQLHEMSLERYLAMKHREAQWVSAPRVSKGA
jgi:hypothetical protein